MAERLKTPIWFWVLVVLAILFNSGGVFAYVSMQISPKIATAGMTPEQTAYFSDFPAWYDAVYALTTHLSFLACLVMAFRSRYAFYIFAISLVLYLFSSFWNFGLRDLASIMGIGNIVFSIVIGSQLAALTLFSRWAPRMRYLT